MACNFLDLRIEAESDSTMVKVLIRGEGELVEIERVVMEDDVLILVIE